MLVIGNTSRTRGKKPGDYVSTGNEIQGGEHGGKGTVPAIAKLRLVDHPADGGTSKNHKSS